MKGSRDPELRSLPSFCSLIGLALIAALGKPAPSASYRPFLAFLAKWKLGWGERSGTPDSWGGRGWQGGGKLWLWLGGSQRSVKVGGEHEEREETETAAKEFRLILREVEPTRVFG